MKDLDTFQKSFNLNKIILFFQIYFEKKTFLQINAIFSNIYN